MKTKSQWQTSELAAAFLEGVRGAIPTAGLQLDVMAHIIRSWHPEPQRILDLGCGDGAVGRFLLRRFPMAQVVFADFSEPMLAAAKKQLAGHHQALVVKADFSAAGWLTAVRDHGPFDVVVSGFAIHHQPDQRKKSLYTEIFGLLDAGGLFLNLEHVAPASPAGESLFDEYFIDHLHHFHQQKEPGKRRDEIAQAFYNRPDKAENILAPVADQCAWLQRIGFRDVDCFLKVFDLALFGGRKEG